MSSRLALMHVMLSRVARGTFDHDYIKVYADDAKVLVDVIDELMRLRGELAAVEALRPAQTAERVDLDELEAVARRLATRSHGADAKRVLRAMGELAIRRATVTTSGPAELRELADEVRLAWVRMAPGPRSTVRTQSNELYDALGALSTYVSVRRERS